MPVRRRVRCFLANRHFPFPVCGGSRQISSLLAFPIAPEQGLSGLLVPFNVCSGQMNYELGCPNSVAGKTKEQRSHSGQHTESTPRQGLSLWSRNTSALILIRIVNGAVGAVELV